MSEKWERREHKKDNAREMRVHGAGLRNVWQAIVERSRTLGETAGKPIPPKSPEKPRKP